MFVRKSRRDAHTGDVEGATGRRVRAIVPTLVDSMTADHSRTPLRILGIDPGLTRCGVGVVEKSGAAVRMAAGTCIRTATDAPIERRLQQLHRDVAALIRAHRPHAVAVERVLFSANVRTAMATGQAAGVALLAAAEADLAVHAYSPNEVKLTVAGDGSADKDAVARMVARQLGLPRAPTPVDVTDALAVALTHAARSRIEALAASTGGSAVLAEAEREAARASRGGWEAVLGDRLPAPPGPARRVSR